MLAIDRGDEYLNSVAAAKSSAAPPVEQYIAGGGVLVVHWIWGRTFTEADVREPENLPRIAAACRMLHVGPGLLVRLQHVRHPGALLGAGARAGIPAADRYEEFAPQVARLKAAMAEYPEPTVPCNNDLLAGNIIDDGERLWLIDYEYAGNNEATSNSAMCGASPRSTTTCSSRSSTPTGRRSLQRGWRERGCGPSCRSMDGLFGRPSRIRSVLSTSTTGRGGWRSTSVRRARSTPPFRRLARQDRPPLTFMWRVQGPACRTWAKPLREHTAPISVRLSGDKTWVGTRPRNEEAWCQTTNSLTADEQKLAELGYKQELSRAGAGSPTSRSRSRSSRSWPAASRPSTSAGTTAARSPSRSAGR